MHFIGSSCQTALQTIIASGSESNMSDSSDCPAGLFSSSSDEERAKQPVSPDSDDSSSDHDEAWHRPQAANRIKIQEAASDADKKMAESMWRSTVTSNKKHADTTATTRDKGHAETTATSSTTTETKTTTSTATETKTTPSTATAQPKKLGKKQRSKLRRS
jgi:hypothetical protein